VASLSRKPFKLAPLQRRASQFVSGFAAFVVAESVAQGKLDMLRMTALCGFLTSSLFTSLKFSAAVMTWSASGGSLK
jgi:hypothetical protein